MLRKAKEFLIALRLESFARTGLLKLKALFWKFSGRNRRLFKSHLAQNRNACLQVGCGSHLLHGWLNADLNPLECTVFQLDATQPFPFSSDTFDFVFSEHMIEHISHEDGRRMLSECFRVLKPGGRIRLSTPDFRFLIDLYERPAREINKQYIVWAIERFLPQVSNPGPIHVINNFVRAWGHLFVYDESSLSRSMESIGFIEIERCPIGQSAYAPLNGLESENRLPPGLLAIETMTLEASKPK